MVVLQAKGTQQSSGSIIICAAAHDAARKRIFTPIQDIKKECMAILNQKKVRLVNDETSTSVCSFLCHIFLLFFVKFSKYICPYFHCNFSLLCWIIYLTYMIKIIYFCQLKLILTIHVPIASCITKLSMGSYWIWFFHWKPKYLGVSFVIALLVSCNHILMYVQVLFI